MTGAHPRRIVWLLAAATLLPIAVLSWLGSRVLQQDREAERQRRQDRLSVAAQQVALDLERRLEQIEDQLSKGDGLRFAADGPVPTAASPLLYRPSALVPQVSSNSRLRNAEAAEYQRHDPAAAAAEYRSLSGSTDSEVRAAALVGLARVLRKTGDRAGALQAYRDLETLGSVTAAGQPAGLVARQGRARLFEEAGDAPQLREAAEDLAGVLHRGGWAIDRATFEVDEELLRRWGAPAASPASIAHTDAAIRLWRTWRAGELSARGRLILRDAEASHLAIWTGGPDQPVVWLATPDDLDRLAGPIKATQSLRVSGRDSEGRRLFGDMQAGGIAVMPGDTRLPFILNVAPVDGSADAGGSLRRAVLVSTLAVAFALMVAAAYGLYRATTRELTLARHQTDFVSAVSHEFRTPLTSMRHLMDLLVTRGVVSDDRRAHYYQLLAHETERLHRMVEGLLSFGRIEARAYAWKLEAGDAGSLVQRVTDEFRGEHLAKDRLIRYEVEGNLPPVRVDADALSRAVWNLLENAAKYSSPGTPIDVRVARLERMVRISVQDRGAGIAQEDRQRVFEKFARGAGATRAGISGVGIGLALVKRIVEAHGGRVILESKPGQGSTFTIELPIDQASGLRPQAPAEEIPQVPRPEPQATTPRQRSA